MNSGLWRVKKIRRICRRIGRSEVLDHFLNRFIELSDVIRTDIVNQVGINIKIVVTYNVSHALDLLPVNPSVLRQKAILSHPIEVFQAFSNGNQLHANCVQLLHASLSICKIISGSNRFKPPLDSLGRIAYLLKDFKN
jgi:hypothetical protein